MSDFFLCFCFQKPGFMTETVLINCKFLYLDEIFSYFPWTMFADEVPLYVVGFLKSVSFIKGLLS